MIRKVRRGDRLSIRASDWNRVAEAADWVLSNRSRILTGSVASNLLRSGEIIIRNDGSSPRSRFDVLGLSGPVVPPHGPGGIDQSAEWASSLAFRGVDPDDSHGGGQWAICLEPISVGSLGRAKIDGIAHSRVKVLDESHTHADVNSDESLTMLCTTIGSGAKLIWLEPESDRESADVAYAILRLSGAPESRIFMGIVEGCSRDAGGDTYVTVRPLTAPPYATDPETVDAIPMVWAGPDAMTVFDSLVWCFPISPLRDAPEIKYGCIPHFAIDPQVLDEPSGLALTSYFNPCPTTSSPDPCLGSP